jgi:hypothetical protein
VIFERVLHIAFITIAEEAVNGERGIVFNVIESKKRIAGIVRGVLLPMLAMQEALTLLLLLEKYRI